ncbi:MAG: dTMP kinase [Geopsychrobacter sp.]|nr:dTMP kinase [Geopsychrobacter sp.]
MSFFITFEGIEGSGKSTQITLLRDALKKSGYPVVETREPGGCPIADQIRSILLHPKNSNINATTELLLYAAARAQHVNDVIRPSLEQERLVLCDRYTDATYAYQGDGRNLDAKLIRQLNLVAAQGIFPDLTILIDLPVETGLGRALSREATLQDDSEGRFERETIDFHKRVRDGYLNLAKQEPSRFVLVDGALAIEDLAVKILQVTLNFLETRADRP